MENTPERIPRCEDIILFDAYMRKLRLADDRIKCRVNESIPTQSFIGKLDVKTQCESLHRELLNSHALRSQAIHHCLESTKSKLKAALDLPEESQSLKSLKNLNNLKRHYQSELFEEEIVQRAALKAFDDGCRAFMEV